MELSTVKGKFEPCLAAYVNNKESGCVYCFLVPLQLRKRAIYINIFSSSIICDTLLLCLLPHPLLHPLPHPVSHILPQPSLVPWPCAAIGEIAELKLSLVVEVLPMITCLMLSFFYLLASRLVLFECICVYVKTYLLLCD